MTFYYTATSAFDQDYDENDSSWKKMPETSWDKYLEQSKLKHVTEIVSTDSMLNEPLVETDDTDPDYWKYMVFDGYITNFFTSYDYVLQKIRPRKRFNLLAVVVNPTEDSNNMKLENFEFAGYDLLDKFYGNSALTNCGGFDETFLPAELNQFGLIDNFEKAYDIKRRLWQNNPSVEHADTNVIAIWRHNTIGRKK